MLFIDRFIHKFFAFLDLFRVSVFWAEANIVLN
jgi:hypothetical protein